jgi:phage terminase small subunit
MGQTRMTPRAQLFLENYMGVAKLNATEAARLAGYAHPRSAAPILKRRLRQAIEEKELALAAKAKLSVEEAESILADIARTEGHKDRLKAVELVLKVNGKLSEKLNINLDKPELLKELEIAFNSLQNESPNSAPVKGIPN